jgi:hypothetical protein
MPGEFFDALGKISGYAVELGDSIRDTQTPLANNIAYGFEIERNGNIVHIYGTKSERTFLVEYRFRISNHLPVTEDEVQQQADEIEGVDVDVEQLRARIRKHKLQNIEGSAIDDALEAAKSEAEDIETGIVWQHYSEEESDLWDGFTVRTRLYPYTSSFDIQNYDETVKVIISDGVSVASSIFNSLDMLGEEGAPDLSEAKQSRHDRTYQ